MTERIENPKRIPAQTVNDDIVEKMFIAQWNAIPGHVDYHAYMAELKNPEEVRAAFIRHMHAAVDVLIKPDDKGNHG